MKRREDYNNNLRRDPSVDYGYNSPDRYQNNGANYYNYIPHRRHHWLIGLLIVILCLGVGWLAADHWLNSGNAPQSTVNRTIVNKKTVSSNPPNQEARSVQQPDVGRLEKEMNRLNVNEKDQATAVNFYEKQSSKNQLKMDKLIKMINRVIPSDTLKRKALRWILS